MYNKLKAGSYNISNSITNSILLQFLAAYLNNHYDDDDDDDQQYNTNASYNTYNQLSLSLNCNKENFLQWQIWTLINSMSVENIPVKLMLDLHSL